MATPIATCGAKFPGKSNIVVILHEYGLIEACDVRHMASKQVEFAIKETGAKTIAVSPYGHLVATGCHAGFKIYDLGQDRHRVT
jgi:hypothetical protein